LQPVLNSGRRGDLKSVNALEATICVSIAAVGAPAGGQSFIRTPDGVAHPPRCALASNGPFAALPSDQIKRRSFLANRPRLLEFGPCGCTMLNWRRHSGPGAGYFNRRLLALSRCLRRSREGSAPVGTSKHRPVVATPPNATLELLAPNKAFTHGHSPYPPVPCLALPCPVRCRRARVGDRTSAAAVAQGRFGFLRRHVRRRRMDRHRLSSARRRPGFQSGLGAAAALPRLGGLAVWLSPGAHTLSGRLL
jgi:hypothetical protein